VYQSLDYQNNWDGKGMNNLLGQDLPNGTYYYILEATDTKMNKTDKFSGYITLRRD
jgi:hypothetical protein